MSDAVVSELARLSRGCRIVDLAPMIENGMPRWPTHPPLVLHPTVTHEHDGYYCQTLFMPEHIGAHVDMPAHIHASMQEDTVDSVDPGILVGPARLFDMDSLELGPGETVDEEQLAAIESKNPDPLTRGDIALLNFGWYRRYWSISEWKFYAENAPGLTEGAARWLMERGVRAVGSDTIACDQPIRNGVAGKSFGHDIYWLPNHIYIMECLANLHLLPPRSFFVALPLKIRRGSGSPLRPVALVPK